MSMGAKTIVLDVLRDLGAKEAAELRTGAADMDGTAIIAMERAVPAWNKQQDYTGWPVGSPVSDENQVWTLITPHRAADHEGRPSTLRALWSLCHTKDPTKAKPWVDSYGTSGLYKKDECYLSANRRVFRCLVDETNYDAEAMPSYWEEVQI